MRIICISDTHGQLHHLPKRIPDGDVLVIAGDICAGGIDYELELFDGYLEKLPHRHKILVAGNHDWPLLEAVSPQCERLMESVTYLQDSGTVIDGVKFWGSPWQPEFFSWAFNLPRGRRLAEIWAQIPADVDVLVTHTPPYGILDTLPDGVHVGCEDLRREFLRIKPRLHVFGHIHSGYGQMAEDGTIFVNAALCGEGHQLANGPIVIELF